MKRYYDYGIALLALFSLPFCIIGCEYIAPYGIANVQPERAFHVEAEIYRTILGTSEELTENWSSWIYVPYDPTSQSYPSTDYAHDKINEYINESLAPGFYWRYRNLNIAATPDRPRNMAGADCAQNADGSYMLPPRTYGGPNDNQLVFDTLAPDYRFVSIRVYNENSVLVDQVDVPISYAEVAFAERPKVPGISNWPVARNHLEQWGDKFRGFD